MQGLISPWFHNDLFGRLGPLFEARNFRIHLQWLELVLTDRKNIPRVSTDGFRIVFHLMDVVLHVKAVKHWKKSVEERVVRSLKNITCL